ncbi:MAG TPA: hypothetical protein VEK76_10795 [Candidatus Binatia bacterium]|nr:hypothetical protein [Candidatus Binatia bacterium]
MDRLVRLVQVVDAGLLGTGFVLLGLGAWLALSTSTHPVGIAVLAAGGAVTPTGNLVATLKDKAEWYIATVSGLFVVGVALVVIGTIADALTTLGTVLITAGAAIMPTGAKPPPVTPKATTEAVHVQRSGRVTLRGAIAPRGQLVTWQFVYGASTMGGPYPDATEARYVSEKGNEPVAVYAEVAGARGMHYRLEVASTTSGTFYAGGDQEVK